MMQQVAHADRPHLQQEVPEGIQLYVESQRLADIGEVLHVLVVNILVVFRIQVFPGAVAGNVGGSALKLGPIEHHCSLEPRLVQLCRVGLVLVDQFQVVELPDDPARALEFAYASDDLTAHAFTSACFALRFPPTACNATSTAVTALSSGEVFVVR